MLRTRARRPRQSGRYDSERTPQREKPKKEEQAPTPEAVILQRRRRLNDQREVISFFSRLAVLAVLLTAIFGLVFGVTAMPDESMKPRLSAGDLLLYYRLEKQWHSGDVVVYEKDGEQYVGRIIARGGDSVEVTEDARLVVNGSRLAESDIYYSTPRYEDGITYPVELEKGQLFVLGDYRTGARDSRYFGAVNENEVKGKVITAVRRSGL